jgi:hypothetical protein
VIYNSKEKDAFMVTRDDGTIIEFGPSTKGLYHYDFTKSIMRHAQKTMVVNTVTELQRKYTRRGVEGADKARRLYVIVGRPSNDTFKMMLEKGLVLNNPVTVTDYENALSIYGNDLGVIKGKTVRNKSDHVPVNLSCFPKEKMNLVLSVYIMHIMEVSFPVTVIRDIRFIMATVISDRRRKTITEAMNQVINLYNGRGHKIEEMEFSEYRNPIHTVLADNESKGRYRKQRDMPKCGSKEGTCSRSRKTDSGSKRKSSFYCTDAALQENTKKAQNCYDSLCGILVELVAKIRSRIFAKGFSDG